MSRDEVLMLLSIELPRLVRQLDAPSRASQAAAKMRLADLAQHLQRPPLRAHRYSRPIARRHPSTFTALSITPDD